VANGAEINHVLHPVVASHPGMEIRASIAQSLASSRMQAWGQALALALEYAQMTYLALSLAAVGQVDDGTRT